MKLTLAVVLAVFSTAGLAKAPKGAITYRVNKRLTDGRPEVAQSSIRTQKDDFALKVEFDVPPTGACGERCAQSTFLLDTDNDAATGLQQGLGKAHTGADLAITLQGSADKLAVLVRQFKDEDRTVEDGDVVQQLDSVKDPRAVKLDGKTVNLLVDASSATLPSGKQCRLVFLPRSARPLTTQCEGMGKKSEPGDGVRVQRSRSTGRSQGGPASAADAAGGTTTPGAVQIKPGGSAYDPKAKPRWGEGG